MTAVWQTVTRSVTNIKTASFTTALIASLFLPMLAEPSIAHAGGINNTRGDAWGTLEVAGNNPSNLGGAGVAIYSNGSQVTYTPNKPNNTVNGVVSGEEWQCVEFVNRLYLTKGWTNATWTGYGGQLYDKATAVGLTARELNGYITYLSPGDTLVLQDSGFGHAAIINTYNSSTGAIQIESQNTNVVFDSTFSLSNKTISSTGWGTYSVKGIVHHPNTPPPAPWPGVGSATFLNADHLNTGQIMTSSQYIVSGNVQHALIMQSDGNLVEYAGTSAVWSSNTGGHSGAYLGLQSDGNIVIYSSSGSPLWATNTGGQSLSYLDMQDDGNIVAYNTSGSPIWASNTDGFPVGSYVGADHLNDGATLTGGYYLRSADKRYALLMQTDGSLALFGPGYHVLWSTGTGGHPGAYFGLQGDGNMVVYSSSGSPLWASNTSGQSLSYLVLQTDGNLVAVNTSGHAIWATGTNGQI